MQFDHLIHLIKQSVYIYLYIYDERGKKICSKIILRAACDSGQKLYFRVEALS